MTAVMGTRMLRKEDPSLLTGEDKFIDDIHAPGELWMVMVRSTMAHAKVHSIDTSEAEQVPGVHAVYTGQQLADMGVTGGPLPCAWPVTDDMVNPRAQPRRDRRGQVRRRPGVHHPRGQQGTRR